MTSAEPETKPRFFSSLALLLPGWLAALGLWFVGLVTTPAPWMLIALLAAACLWGGLGALVFGRRKGLRLLGALSLLTPLVFVGAFFLGRGEEARWLAREARDRPGERVRLLCWNVKHGYPSFPDQERRGRAMVEGLAGLDPDIVVLQEAWRTRSQGDLVEGLAARLRMDAFFVRANASLRLIGFEEGSAVLSRFRLSATRGRELKPAARFWERRVAAQADVLVGAERWRIVTCHLASGRSIAGDGQADGLASDLGPWGAPTIVAGDFNSGAEGPRVGSFVGRGFQSVNSARIDHVLGRNLGSWRVKKAEVLDPKLGGERPLSDHPLLLVDFERAR